MSVKELVEDTELSNQNLQQVIIEKEQEIRMALFAVRRLKDGLRDLALNTAKPKQLEFKGSEIHIIEDHSINVKKNAKEIHKLAGKKGKKRLKNKSVARNKHNMYARQEQKPIKRNKAHVSKGYSSSLHQKAT